MQKANITTIIKATTDALKAWHAVQQPRLLLINTFQGQPTLTTPHWSASLKCLKERHKSRHRIKEQMFKRFFNAQVKWATLHVPSSYKCRTHMKINKASNRNTVTILLRVHRMYKASQSSSMRYHWTAAYTAIVHLASDRENSSGYIIYGCFFKGSLLGDAFSTTQVPYYISLWYQLHLLN